MKSNYKEVDRGRFESCLLRKLYGDVWVAVARTYGDEVRLCVGYKETDREAVEEYAEQYDLPVDWKRGA